MKVVSTLLLLLKHTENRDLKQADINISINALFTIINTNGLRHSICLIIQ